MVVRTITPFYGSGSSVHHYECALLNPTVEFDTAKLFGCAGRP
jgi:hypothetical protein